jgi:hypothetical protein
MELGSGIFKCYAVSNFCVTFECSSNDQDSYKGFGYIDIHMCCEISLELQKDNL